VSVWKKAVVGILVLLLVVNQIPSWAFAAEQSESTATVVFEIEEVIEGDIPQEDVPFTFVLQQENGDAPLPAENTVTISGAGSASFQEIVYMAKGIYEYTIREVDEKREGYTYDASIYHIRVSVENDDAGRLKATYSVYKEGEDGKSASLRFTNQYQETKLKLTRVSVEKQEEDGTPVKGAVLRIIDSDGKKMDEWTTNGSVHVTPEIFTVGQEYRLLEVSEPEDYKIAEDILFTAEDDQSTEPIVMVDQKTKHTTGSAQVTTYLTMMGQPLAAREDVYYVALFEDKECQKRVTDVRELQFLNASSVSTTFYDLEIGKQYYVSGTDENGIAIKQGTLETGETFTAEYGEGQSIIVSEDGTADFSMENLFLTLPVEYYLEAELTVTKQLLGADGEAKNSDEIFYAGIFADASFGHLSEDVSENIVALALDGASEVSQNVRVALPSSGTITLYVTEVDETGIPVDEESFGYMVMISSEEVTLTADDYQNEVIITNLENPEGEEPAEGPDDETEPTESEELTEAPDAGSETETEILTEVSAQTESEDVPDDESEPVQSSNQTENHTSQNSSGTGSAPRTADDTDLNQWMELLFLSGIGVLSLAVARRKKNHRAM
jgi:pilin isopeptide linkage protein